ncbi:hypothetical protein CPB86DRAFT_778844 [Serendipita vermifera]|nr:hypothetical protein CPB86DRAFT_778844 [Serendipita vermifera]
MDSSAIKQFQGLSLHPTFSWKEKESDNELQDAHASDLDQAFGYPHRLLKDLKPIDIEDIQFRRRKKGHYLLCRITSVPVRSACIKFTVGDTKGHSVAVSLYHFPGTLSANSHELRTILPLHTIIALREPFTKTLPTFSTYVDTPSDVIFIEHTDPLLKNTTWSNGLAAPDSATQPIEQWKKIGDGHFKDKQYFAAAVAYTYALQRDPQHIPIRLNRCLSHIRLENFAHALSDAKAIIALEGVEKSDKRKALYRAALSEYGALHYPEAKKLYLDCLELDPNLKEAKDGWKRCDSRMKETSDGKYDWLGLFKASLLPSYRPDIAEFRGPVTITSLPHRGGGRGVTATRDIAVGESLVVTRPFASAFEADSEELCQTLGSLANTIDTDTTSITFQRIIDEIALNPSRNIVLLSLSLGAKSDFVHLNLPY